MRKHLKVLGCVMLGLLPMAGTADTVADTMTLAYRNSGLLDQNRALLRAADEDVAQAVASLRPIINWAGNVTYTHGFTNQEIAGQTVTIEIEKTTATLELTGAMTLFDFGAGQLAVDAAKESVLATRQRLIATEQSVLLRAVQAHLEVRRTLEQLELRRSNVRLITRQRDAAKERFEVGEVTRTDIAYAESRLAAARAQVAAAEGDLARASEEYRAVTGQRPNRLSSVSAAAITRDIDAARRYAVRHHPSALEQRHNVSAAELNIRRAEAATKPKLQLQGRLGVDGDLNAGQSLSLSIGGPIYSGGALESRIRQARAQRDAARAGLHQTSAALEQQVGNAYALMRVTRLAKDATDRQVRAARVAYNGVQEEAKLGASTTLAVLDAEQSLLNARVQQVSNMIDQVLASYNALAAMGQLTAESLNLPVQRYDPSTYYKLVERAPSALSQQGRDLDRVLESIGK